MTVFFLELLVVVQICTMAMQWLFHSDLWFFVWEGGDGSYHRYGIAYSQVINITTGNMFVEEDS